MFITKILSQNCKISFFDDIDFTSLSLKPNTIYM